MRPMHMTPYRRGLAIAAQERARERAAADREHQLRERLEALRQALAHAQQEVVYLREQNGLLQARLAHLSRRKQRKPTSASFERYRREHQRRASAEFVRRAFGRKLARERAWRFRKD